ncbi:hypothetical protein CCACVL1_14809 [Corchorus capsularis]|uniref:Uncharacterized protein n=1 Tax=Corchorus capsularis TaxID=210143 RepID=A0A1R3I5F5_COCAP|nr:hypothetical protein CCACVL1_14809 [Corchorus capsularis]
MGSTRGAVQRLVTIRNDVGQGIVGNKGLELCPGGEVLTTLGNRTGLEAAGGTDIEVRDEGLVRIPARLGGVGGWNERSGAFKVVGENQAEALANVIAGAAAVGEERLEDGEV